MFDTHCHLNFKSFRKTLPEAILGAREAGVSHIVVPGTDIPSSKYAIEIASENDGIYAAVGIHPHHVYGFCHPERLVEGSGSQLTDIDSSTSLGMTDQLTEIEKLLSSKKTVAIGEVGMDRHVYEKTKYADYSVNEQFISIQKELFVKQVELAVKYKKSLIIHNREAKSDLLPELSKSWDKSLEGRTVFHCCEPDAELLDYAKQHKMFIGVDGDITYRKDKQEFIRQIPIDMLVVETDAPFLLPEPLRTEKQYPNRPANIPLILAYIAGIINIEKKKLGEITSENAIRLFNITKKEG